MVVQTLGEDHRELTHYLRGDEQPSFVKVVEKYSSYIIGAAVICVAALWIVSRKPVRT